MDLKQRVQVDGKDDEMDDIKDEEGKRNKEDDEDTHRKEKDDEDPPIEDKNDEDPPIFIYDDCPDPTYWIQFSGDDDDDTYIVLYTESKFNILGEGYWLCDSVIHDAGLQLLKQQYPYIGGLADPAIRGNVVNVETHEFVQIINIGGGHWICNSTVGCKHGVINLYDSMTYGGRSNKPAIWHAARMMGTRERNIQFVVQQVTQLFALPFATSICLGEDPSSRMYE